jgi:putative ABC transport system permease protein
MISVTIGALSLGFIFFPLALGVFISYRILRFPDITVDGAFSLGAVISARMLIAGVEPITATLFGMLAGALAGLLTAVLITRFDIQKLLAGILVMTALYSVNVLILGQGSYSFNDEVTLYRYAQDAALSLFGTKGAATILGVRVFATKFMVMLFAGALALVLLTVLSLFFRTRFGLALRGAGENPSAVRAVGANVSLMIVSTLMLSNALAALSGSMFAQQLDTADTSNGIGMIVTGLACVLIGDAFFGRKSFRLRLFGALIGAVLYYIIIGWLMLTGEVENALLLFTALFVFLALVLPRWLHTLLKRETPEGEA